MNSVNVEEELARIDKLEREGDWIEAIAALSSLNRKRGECWFFGPSNFPEKQIPMIF